MTITRRDLLIGTAAIVTTASTGARAQPIQDVVIGVIYPFSGSSAQIGVDAKHAFNTAADIINNVYDLDLPLARSAGLPGLGGAKVRLVFADHQADPQKGRAEAERLITQEKVCAIIGTYQSAVAVTVSQICERYQIPFISADNSSPSLHRRGLKFYFRAAPHDEMFSTAMFDFFDALKKKGQKIETLALFHEDTIFGTDSSNAQLKLAADRGYKVVADIKYRANSPSLTAEVQQIKAANADVLMPSSYTTDGILLVKTMAELGYKPKAIVAQDAGFSEKALYDAVGDKLEGVISRGSFSLDLAAKRPMVGKINELFKARSGKDLNDDTSREFMGLLILADGIDRAKSTDGEKIREALAATDMPGERTIMPWKRVKFDEMGQNNDADPVLLQYVKGKFVTIFPAQAAIAEPIWPMNPSGAGRPWGGKPHVQPRRSCRALLSGLLTGLIYALIAVGLALIFGLMDVVNFAHGEFLMIAMYATFGSRWYWRSIRSSRPPSLRRSLCLRRAGLCGDHPLCDARQDECGHGADLLDVRPRHRDARPGAVLLHPGLPQHSALLAQRAHVFGRRCLSAGAAARRRAGVRRGLRRAVFLHQPHRLRPRARSDARGRRSGRAGRDQSEPESSCLAGASARRSSGSPAPSWRCSSTSIPMSARPSR